MRFRLLIMALLVLLAAKSQGQEAIVVKDTVNPVIVVQAHNPTKAVLLSIIPGAGQIYNGQAWKLPIIYGALGAVGYLTYMQYSDMKMFKNEYLRIVSEGGVSQLEEYPNYPASSLYNLYQTSNKNFQMFVLITAAVYGLNLLDAYVFGHLYDFEVNDNLAVNFTPALLPTSNSFTIAPTVGLCWRF